LLVISAIYGAAREEGESECGGVSRQVVLATLQCDGSYERYVQRTGEGWKTNIDDSAVRWMHMHAVGTNGSRS